jgi:4-hydroxy-4-methyl-2-oxoglutarate aldolase
MLSHSDLLKLKRWNTPTVYNGWEQITKHDRCTQFNQGLYSDPLHAAHRCRKFCHCSLSQPASSEVLQDFMPQMGPMVGYAVTLVVEPSNPQHSKANPNAWDEYRKVCVARWVLCL